MEEFDLKKAKAGSPVCTRGGRDVTIFTFYANNPEPIFGVVHTDKIDRLESWSEKGEYMFNETNIFDLMMKV